MDKARGRGPAGWKRGPTARFASSRTWPEIGASDCSNSIAGNSGSRRISPRSLMAAGSVERLASTENVNRPGVAGPPPPPPPAAASAAEAAQAGGDADAERIQFLAQRLPIVLLGAGHHQSRQHAGRCRLSLERLLVAVVQASVPATPFRRDSSWATGPTLMPPSSTTFECGRRDFRASGRTPRPPRPRCRPCSP